MLHFNTPGPEILTRYGPFGTRRVVYDIYDNSSPECVCVHRCSNCLLSRSKIIRTAHDCMTVSSSCYCWSVVKRGSNRPRFRNSSVAQPFPCARPFCVMCIYSYIECLLNIYLQVERFVLEGQEQPGEHSLVQQSELNSARNGRSSRLNVVLSIMTTGCAGCKDSPLF